MPGSESFGQLAYGQLKDPDPSGGGVGLSFSLLEADGNAQEAINGIGTSQGYAISESIGDSILAASCLIIANTISSANGYIETIASISSYGFATSQAEVAAFEYDGNGISFDFAISKGFGIIPTSGRTFGPALQSG